jgi:hypothetical protein
VKRNFTRSFVAGHNGCFLRGNPPCQGKLDEGCARFFRDIRGLICARGVDHHDFIGKATERRQERRLAASFFTGMGTERGTRTFAPFGRPSPPAPDYLFPASNRREPRRCASSDFLSFRIMKFAGRRLESVSFLCRARSILLVLLLDSRVRRLRAQ